MNRFLRKALVSTLILIFLLSFSFFYESRANQKKSPEINAVIIGWDGAQREHVKECLERGELPNLKLISSEGNLVAIDILRVTDTKAGWAQILTGYEPETNGVFSNKMYKPIPKGYTIFERLENYFGSGNIITGAIIGKGNHVGADKGLPYYNAKDSMDFFVNKLGKNFYVGELTLSYIEKYKDKPFMFFVHFADVDTFGHMYGENSKEYSDALISCDYWTGEIISKLKDLNIYDKTYIYITADHGFDEGKRTHSDAPYVFLATNDNGVIRRGFRTDITPTVLDKYGLNLEQISPSLDGNSLRKPYSPPLW